MLYVCLVSCGASALQINVQTVTATCTQSCGVSGQVDKCNSSFGIENLQQSDRSQCLIPTLAIFDSCSVPWGFSYMDEFVHVSPELVVDDDWPCFSVRHGQCVPFSRDSSLNLHRCWSCDLSFVDDFAVIWALESLESCCQFCVFQRNCAYHNVCTDILACAESMRDFKIACDWVFQHVLSFSWSIHVFRFTHRFGEALHPGPDSSDVLRCGNLNPAQILNNEDTIAGFGEGVWTVSETSHTSSARAISQKRFKDAGFYTLFGPDAHPHTQGNAGTLRGKATGVAIISSLPLAKFPIAPVQQLRRVALLMA